MNKEFKKLLEFNMKETDKEIEKFLPKNFDTEWLDFSLNKIIWEHDKEAYTEAIARPVWNLLERGGKRWRPFLMKLSYDAVSDDNTRGVKADRKDIKNYLALPELIHNGTLIIDDIEDSSELRRGMPCVHKIFGTDLAINAGNSMYFLPLLVFMRDKSLSSNIKTKIYELILGEMINLSFGQGMDIFWKTNKRKISENQYLQMCAYKTGSLARMSAKLGVILAEGNKIQEEALGKFAESLGVAFQIQDDILSLTGSCTGKDLGEDITEGKRSLMIIKVLENGTEKDKNRIIEILRMNTKNKELIKEAIEIINKYNVMNYAGNIAKILVENAWNELDSVIRKSEAKDKLKMFADFVINRNR